MSSHAAGTWASQNRLNQTGRIPDAEKRVEYSRGIMAQGSQNQHKEWARRGISGENTSNNGLPKGGSPGAMRDALAGSPKNHGRVDHARKELFGNLQPRAEFNRNPDLTGREGNLARNRSDLRPYNSGTPLSMAAATLEDAQGRAPAADEPESSHGRRRNAELAPYNEGIAGISAPPDLPPGSVKPGVLADDESPGYYGRKKTLVTDDAMRGASPTGCAESRMGKADEYFAALPDYGRKFDSDVGPPRESVRPGVLAAEDDMPNHGRKKDAELGGCMDVRPNPNVLSEGDEMPYHGRKKTSATNEAMQGHERRLELAPAAGATLRPDQEADRCREAIRRKNSGSTGIW